MDENEFYSAICNALGVGGLTEDDVERAVSYIKAGLNKGDDLFDFLTG